MVVILEPMAAAGRDVADYCLNFVDNRWPFHHGLACVDHADRGDQVPDTERIAAELNVTGEGAATSDN
jgi:hypothetical protein